MVWRERREKGRAKLGRYRSEGFSPHYPCRRTRHYDDSYYRVPERRDRYNKKKQDKDHPETALRIAVLEDTSETMELEIAGVKKIVAIMWRRLTTAIPFLSQTIDTGELKSRNLLSHLIQHHFDLEELDGLAYEMGINPENFGGDTLKARTEKLIRYTERNAMLSILVATCEVKRPNIEWPDIS